MTVTDIPPIIDVDAHVVEPADVWSPRLPAKYREVGPHVRYLPSGTRDGTWPGSVKAAQEQFGHLDETAVRKIARGNAIKLFGLPFQACAA
jgi:hypothetical protein